MVVKMKADLIYLIRGKEGKYFQRLINKTGEKFNEKEVIEDRIPPHITLKRPFEINNLKEFEKMLIDFTKMQKSAKLKINGIYHFRKSVIFAKPELSKEAIKIQGELINFLSQKGIEPNKLDDPFNPHITIVKNRKLKKFNQIWNYLIKIKIPKLNLKLDNITIVLEQKKYWEVYKMFNLKKGIK
jgi:2'-5' RNA ligase